MRLNTAFFFFNYLDSNHFSSIYTKLKGIHTVSECVHIHMGKFVMFTRSKQLVFCSVNITQKRPATPVFLKTLTC